MNFTHASSSSRSRSTDDDPRSESLVFRGRIIALLVVVILAVMIIAGRLTFLQFLVANEWAVKGINQYFGTVSPLNTLGDIVDRNGRVLAGSNKVLSVALHPHWLKSEEREQFVEQLSIILSFPEERLHKLANSSKTFVWVKRGISLRFEKYLRSLRSRALSIFNHGERSYPQGTVASQIIGAVGKDGEPLSGLELQFGKELQVPTAGSVETLKDGKGNSLISLLGEELPADTDGQTLKITIDSAVQRIFEEELEIGRIEAEAARAYGLIMDAETGEILAMAQNRRPDLSKPIKGPGALRNWSIQDAFEPGSTIKPLVVAMGLEEGVIHKGEVLPCSKGYLRVGRHTIRDIHPSKVTDLETVIIKSLNTCMTEIGFRLGDEQLKSGFRALGFGRRSGVELPGESKGIFRDTKKPWREIELANAAFGQGVAVTGIQLTAAFASLANGGFHVEPTIVKNRDNSKVKTRVFSDASLGTVRTALLRVIEDKNGTGRKAATKGVKVFGKTGTAQKARTDGRGYEPDKVISSFVGWVEGDRKKLRKKLVSLVVIDEPMVKPRWGGTVAAPVFAKTMARVVPMVSLRG